MKVVRILREREAHRQSLDQGWFPGAGRAQEYQVRTLGLREVSGVSREPVISPGHTSSHSVPLTMKASHSRHLAGPLSRRSR